MRRQSRVTKKNSKAAQEFARERLSGRLLDHTLGCVETAEKLACRFDLSVEKAAAAAYLHDIAKPLTLDGQASLAREMGMSQQEIRRYPRAVLHGPLAALIARERLDIEDPEILQAIEAHSTGCAGMCGVAKVVFVADYIEFTRDFPGSSELRSHGHVTLDELAAAILNRKLKHLIEERRIIDSRAIDFWNELIRDME